MNYPELVAPAGNSEKLEIALHYGADAVYLGLKGFNLRAGAANFSVGEATEAIRSVHRRKKKAYLALNAFLSNSDLSNLEKALPAIVRLKPDGMIVSDPALIEMLHSLAPGIPLHLSTQSNVTNWRSVKYWSAQGVKRIVLARELDLDSLREIKTRVPECEIEVFVHGAMCVAYSGRCLLSAYLTGRNANKGDCAQPCRWMYHLSEGGGKDGLILEEDSSGTSILSSRDLCLFDHLPELAEAGIDAFKIEGRLKSAYYVGIVTRSYRKALDGYIQDPQRDMCPEIWREELFKISHREYTTGFLFPGDSVKQTYREDGYIRRCGFLGVVLERDGSSHLVAVREKIHSGQELEIVDPDSNHPASVERIVTSDGKELQYANPNQQVHIQLSYPAAPRSLLRRCVKEKRSEQKHR